MVLEAVDAYLRRFDQIGPRASRCWFRRHDERSARSAVMALTMTRTRTQTALTRLTKLLANLNGELEFVECLMRQMPEQQSVLGGRRLILLSNRDAVCSTIRQFDPETETGRVGRANEWMRAYGRRGQGIGPKYIRALRETA
jgi:hypothetical protein